MKKEALLSPCVCEAGAAGAGGRLVNDTKWLHRLPLGVIGHCELMSTTSTAFSQRLERFEVANNDSDSR